MLSGLVPGTHLQQHLFADHPDGRLHKLSAVVIWLNWLYGRDKARLAGAGYDSSWYHKQAWIQNDSLRIRKKS